MEHLQFTSRNGLLRVDLIGDHSALRPTQGLQLAKLIARVAQTHDGVLMDTRLSQPPDVEHAHHQIAEIYSRRLPYKTPMAWIPNQKKC